MHEPPGFDIRYTYVSDMQYLRQWLNAPGILHWFPMQEEKEIEDSVQCWISFSRFSSSLTAMIADVPCAIGTLFLMPYQKVAHQCLFKLIVDPKFHRQGIGSSLLKNLKHLAKQYFKLELMLIEVFEGNPIVHLLKKQGFSEILRQEKYMKENDTYYARILFECKL